MKCQHCNGTGKVELFSSIANCDDCGGTGIRKGQPSSLSEWMPVLQMRTVCELRQIAGGSETATAARVAANILLESVGERHSDRKGTRC